MNKKERAALIALYTNAVKMNERASPDLSRRTADFIRGYEWGITRTLEILGISWAERYDIWDRIRREINAS